MPTRESAYICIYIYIYIYIYVIASIKIRTMLRKSLNVKKLFILKLPRTFYSGKIRILR